MRVGEILHRDGLVGAEDLATALADQRIAGKRVCSLLLVRGIIEPDQAARALAEQFECAAALTKHLENRDVKLAKLLPANIARQHYALPIGRMRDGEIVICVRDPKPEMQAAFERILQKPVLITVAAAHTIEPLIDMAYGPVATQDFGMRFARPSTQPATVPQPPAPQAFAAGTVRQPSPEASDGVVDGEFDVDMDSAPHQLPDEMPSELSLVDLDDASVDKSDFSMHELKTPTTLPEGAGAPIRQPTLPPMDTTRTPAKK